MDEWPQGSVLHLSVILRTLHSYNASINSFNAFVIFLALGKLDADVGQQAQFGLSFCRLGDVVVGAYFGPKQCL